MSTDPERPAAQTEPDGPRAFSYTDAHGVVITAYEWAAPEPLGVVQIAHGLGEHARRYDDFARALVAAGLTVLADDHRGHGETGRRQHGGDLSRLGRLGPGGLAATEAAILQLTALAREAHPGLPVVLVGQSWGTLMAQRILNREPRVWDAVVLAGTALRTPRFMESGALNRRWAGDGANGFEWLSRDAAVGAAFVADPLCFYADVLGLFGLADGLRLFGTPGPAVAPEVPILIVGGGDDPLSRADGRRRLAEAYRRRGVRDVALKEYPGARHELFNETNRDDVTADVISWILERLPGA
ncbi:alpha/beta hydrolase [Leucobacter allii]|uniref:Alpha/beta hydrolase n=1 Tax=Leucobacter allii TaxID=2932247 RepID=A0ABY4FKP5_9MICO|nr:alpha/beta hydrolase [Leucobacter allii]UOQ56831.1 alpha/beta hydrolase [Leucobacter allii]